MRPTFVLTRNDADEEAAQAARRAIDAVADNNRQNIADALADLGQQLAPSENAGAEEMLALPSRVTEIRTQTMLQDALFELLHTAATAGTDFGIAELGDRVSSGFAWDQAHRQAIDWATGYQYSLVGQIDESTRRFLAAQITDWMESGEPLADLTDRLTWAFGEERAKVIAQTEATRGFAQGSLASYRTSGVVERLRWYTVVDDRVCDICGPLHGMTSSLQNPDFDGIPAPPAHPGCRCRIVPVFQVSRE